MKRIIILLTTFFAFSNLYSQELWSVDDCMRYAITNSPLARRQVLNENNIKRDLTESKLGFAPSISAGTNLNTNFGRSIDPETNTYISSANMSNNYSVSGNITIFSGFENINNYKIAKVAKFREEQESKRIDDQISIETMKAYYTSIFAWGALKIAKENLDDNSKNFHKGKIEHQIGLKSISDLAQLESKVSQSEYNVIYLEGEYQKAILRLKNSMFYPIQETLNIDTMLSASKIDIDKGIDTNGIINTALSHLPEMQIAKHNLRASELKYSTAKAKLFPRLTANGGVSTGYSRQIGSTNAQTDYGEQLKNRLGEYFGVTLSIPIFNSLSLQMNRYRSRNNMQKSQIDLEEKTRELENAVSESLIDLESFAKQCVQSEVNVKANDLSYKTTYAKYNEGIASVIDLQTTQTNLTTAKIDQLKAVLNYIMQTRIVNYYKGGTLIN